MMSAFRTVLFLFVLGFVTVPLVGCGQDADERNEEYYENLQEGEEDAEEDVELGAPESEEEPGEVYGTEEDSD
ncbi:MAG: hypothetical protein AAF752_00655 [Bacteroidota bacterium]